MAQTADIKLPFNDLITYVPKQLRKPMITSLIDNLFNRFLTHDESVPFFGYIGISSNLTENKMPPIPALNVERDINAIVPVFNFSVGDTKHVFTFSDIVNKARTIGIDTENMNWLYSQGNNFVPPIDLDKFTNFFNYYWIAKADKTIVAPTWNPELLPEYYTIAKHIPSSLNKENVVVATTEPITLTGSGFGIVKFELEFIDSRDFNINIIGNIGNLKPINTKFSLSNEDETRIIFNAKDANDNVTQLLAFTIVLDKVFDTEGNLVDKGKFIAGDKLLIDAPFISQIFIVKPFLSKGLKGKLTEINSYDTYQTIDGVQLYNGMRILVKDNDPRENGIYIVRPETFVRAEDFIGANAKDGAKVFVKSGESQTSTFWISANINSGFNFTKIIGVTKSNTNDWQDGNFWVKSTDLSNYDLDRANAIQAKRPIIEYSGDLQLNQFVKNNKPSDTGISYQQQKTQFNQLPHFDLFGYDGTHSGYVSPIFFYEEDLTGTLDVLLQKRVLKSKNESRDFVFNHGAHDTEGLLFFSQSNCLRTVFHAGHRNIILNQPVFNGGGNGTVAIIPSQNASQQIWTIKATSPTTFKVTGTKNKRIPNNEIPLDKNCYFTDEFSITITAGSIPFQIGDTFQFQIGNLEKTNYVTKGNDEEGISNFYGGINADTRGEGAWQIPRMFYNNPYNENNSPIEEGVLYSHFMSILTNQISQKPDLAFGGNIKLWSEQQTLLASLLMQRDLTPISMIELAQKQYENGINQVKDIYKQTIIQYLANYGPVTDKNLNKLLDEILKLRKQDNDVRTVLFDSTSPVVGFPPTLPMLGISELIKPEFIFDGVLGQDLIKCHDGHLITIETDSLEFKSSLLGSLVDMKISRSDGTATNAIGSFTLTPPANPYKGELWLMPTPNGEQTTLIFNVISDGNIAPRGPNVGDYWYSRSTNMLYLWDGTLWTNEPDIINAWQPINLADIQNKLILMVEQRLFSGINGNARKFDFSQLDTSTKFNKLLSNELFTFAAVNNYDPLAPDYKSGDAFTWNYSSGDILNFAKLSSLKVPARWYDILLSHHRAIPGVIPTTRPNLEPFKLLGFETLADWQGAGSTAGVPFNPSYISSTPDRMWSTTMWVNIKAFHINSGLKLSVDILNDNLLPPYISASAMSNRSENALTNIGPTDILNPLLGINNVYNFGENGPVESVWRASIDFGYAKAKALFRYDPLAFLGFCWGFNWAQVDNILYDTYDMNMPGHKRFKLHGDTIIPNGVGTCTVRPVLNSVGDFIVEFTAYDSNRRQNFTIKSSTGNIGFLQEGFEEVFENHSFLVEDHGKAFRIGDKFIISTKIDNSVTFVPETVYKFQGFGQTFTHALRAISVDTNNSYAIIAYRNWEVNMGYRAAGLVSTNDLKVYAGTTELTPSAYDLLIKKNEASYDKWLQSFRIQVTKFGAAEQNIDGVYFPIGRGEDWEFRIEGYNPRYLDISYFDLNDTHSLVTFNALSNSHTDFEWYQPTQVNATKTTKLPLTITGVQNVVNFLFGYSAYLQSEGWEFTSTEKSNIDYETGRSRNWQLEIEKFVDSCFGGIKLGQGHIVNPFMDKVWLNQKTGLLSEFYEISLSDITGHPGVYDALGVKMSVADLNILRSNTRSEISANVPMFSVHAQIDEYEHLFIFNNYSGLLNSGSQLYHPFSGSKILTYKFNGKKQANKTLRPEYAGHFIFGNEVLQNFQASTDSLAQLYDANTMFQNEEASRNALALLGFTKKDYLSNLDITNNAHFNFWRGLIHAKGTNMSVSAYLNNDRFKDVKLDEYWAYKIADYGDSRQKTFPELKLTVADSVQQFTKLQFDPTAGAWDKVKNPQGELPNFTIVSSADESKWTNLEDLHHDASFIAEIVGKVEQTVKTNDVIILPFIADEIIANGKSCTAEYTVLNAKTLKITTGGVLSIIGYGPASPKYNPIKLFNYVDKELIEEIPVWHPAVGIHTPAAMENINIISNINPAKFNYSTQTENNFTYDTLRPWGEKELGRVWFNTSNLTYIPYFDRNLFTNIDERLSRWGGLAEHSTVDVYEWVKSTVPPYEYNEKAKAEAGNADIDENVRAGGEVAGEQTYVREREWGIFPIAWSYTPVLPTLEGGGHPAFFTSFSSVLSIESSNDGQLLYLDSNSFKEYGIFSGMRIGAWDWDQDYPKPLSEMLITDSFTKKIAVINSDGGIGNAFTTITTTIGQITDDSNLTLSFEIKDCSDKILGYAFTDVDKIDPLATKSITDCDGHLAYGYPISSSIASLPLLDCEGLVEVYVSPHNTIQVLLQQLVTVDVEVISHQDIIGRVSIEPVDLVTTLSPTSTTADPVWETPIYVKLIEDRTGKTELLLLNTAFGTIEAREPILYQPAIPEQPATSATYLVKIAGNTTGNTGIYEFPHADINGGLQNGALYTVEIIVDDVLHSFSMQGEDVSSFDKLIATLNLFLPASPVSITDEGILFTSPSIGSFSNIYISGGNLFAMLPSYSGVVRTLGTDIVPEVPEVLGRPGITPTGTHGAELKLQADRPYVFISEVFGLKFTITPKVSGTYVPEAFQNAIVKALIPENSTLTSGALFLQDAVIAKTIVGMAEPFGLVDGVRTLSNDPIIIDDSDDTKNIGWVAWNVPTQAQLDADGQQPNSSWKPYIGDEHPIGSNLNIIQDAIQYFSNPLKLNDGTKINRHSYKWNDWHVLHDTVYNTTNDKSSFGLVDDLMYIHSVAIDTNKTTVYINGIAQLQAMYIIHGKQITVKNVPFGAQLTIIIRKTQPSLVDLAFNPDVKEEYTYQHQYKIDFEYVYLPVRDFEGALTKMEYYFWVKNKTTAAFKKKMSIQSITQELKNGPSNFITFQNLLPKTEALQPRYNAITLSGLNFLVTKDDTFKLRFTRNFTLRDEPNGLDLKDTHSEWTLLRENQRGRIPAKLWEKLADSVIGEDIAGNPIPSIRRQLYDERNNSNIRFGFGEEQALAPIELLRASIKYIILNTKLIVDVAGEELPDYITFLDLDNTDSWFSSINTARETMALIWAQANNSQVNEIFFTAMNDILACNYELTDLFKTSRLSAYSIKDIQTKMITETYN